MLRSCVGKPELCWSAVFSQDRRLGGPTGVPSSLSIKPKSFKQYE